MSSCVIIPKVINKRQEYVESKLFKDLLQFTDNDRDVTKVQYVLAKDPKVIDAIGNKAEFDENGELTIDSLLNYTKLKVDDEKILKTLNKRLGEGEHPTALGLAKVTTFNRTNPKGKFMATFTVVDNDNVTIKIVKRTNKNKKDLDNQVLESSLRGELIYRLGTAGLNVDFLNSSTIKITEVYNNIENIIDVDENKVDEMLADTLSVVIAGLSENSPLYDRLKNTITIEVAKQILGDEFTISSNPIKESIIKLISQRLQNLEDYNMPSKSLVSRIINYIKTKISKIGKKTLEKDIINAKQKAENLIADFNTQEFAESVKQKLKNKEVLAQKDSVNTATFKSIIQILRNQAEQMTIINKKLEGKYKIIPESIIAGKIFDVETVFTNIVTLSGIEEALNLTIDMLPEITNKLQAVNLYDLDENDENKDALRRKYAKDLREIATFLQTSLEIEDIMSKATTQEKTSVRLHGVEEEQMSVLRKSVTALSEGNRIILGALSTKQAELFANGLEDSLGSEYVSTAASVIFNPKFINLENFSIKHPFKIFQKIVVTKGDTQISVRDQLVHLSNDIGLYQRWLNSLSNSNDLVHKTVDKMKSAANKKANDNINEVWDYLMMLQKELKEIGLSDTLPFMEISPRNGKLTGNIISDRLWGDWESDYDNFYKEEKRKFLEENDLRNKDTFQKELLFNSEFDHKRKLWHKLHSTWNSDEQMYYPNSSYRNEAYYENIEGTPKEEWLKKYMDLLTTIKHDALPPGSMRYYRAPQFEGRFTTKIKNQFILNGSFKDGVNAIGRQIRNKFVENSNDFDFGADNTYNRREDDMFGNDLDFEKEKLNRIPLFGINKLQNMDDISTDLFHSTLSFASMAYTHKSLTDIVDILEVGSDAMTKRKMGKNKKVENVKDPSNSYARYQKFLEMQIYNIGHKRHSMDRKMVMAKLNNMMMSVAAKLSLGGNVMGGIANFNQGFMEIFKESVAGEYFTFSNFKRANKMYFDSLGRNLLEAGEDQKQDKVSLMIRHMDIGYENASRYKNFHTTKSRLYKLNPLGENLFLPYKTGEHYMQTIGFLSLMDNVKVSDGDKTISLWDAYEVVPFDATKPNGRKTLTLKKGIKYLDPKTEKYRDWTQADEIELMNKSREINNRLHGIYNKMDKTVFQQYLLGSLLTSMRRYALGMINRRFGKRQYNVALGKEVEGSMITLATVLASTFTDIGGLGLTAKALFIPFSDNTANSLHKAGFSVNQIANMRRNQIDTLVIVLAALLRMGIKKWDMDDDDEEDMGWGLLYYFVSRLYTEQSAFNTIWGLRKELPVLTNITPASVSVLLDFGEFVKLYITQEEYVSTGNKKYIKKGTRFIPYYKSLYPLQHGYKAASSYDYGRTTLTK